MIKNIVDTIVSNLVAPQGKKADSLFLENELSGIATRVLEVQYPEFKGTQLVPLDNAGVSRGQEFLRRKVLNTAGTAEIINSATTVAPNVSLSLDEIRKEVRELGISWSWTVRELEAAAFAQVPLDATYSMAAMRGMASAVDSILATGSTATQPNATETGLLNDAGISATAQNWSAATGEQLLAFLNTIATSSSDATLGVFPADTIVMSPLLLNKLASKPYSSTIGDSVLAIFKQNMPGVEVVSWAKTQSFVSASVDRVVAYKRAPEVLAYSMPIPFEMLPVQYDAYRFTVFCRSTLFGTQILQPAAVKYFDVTR